MKTHVLVVSLAFGSSISLALAEPFIERSGRQINCAGMESAPHGFSLCMNRECTELASDAEMKSIKNECAFVIAERHERATIYDNCVISNSKGIDSSAMRNVRSLCERISENPTMLQRLRWGN